MANAITNSSIVASDLHQYVLWTTISVWIVLAIALFLALSFNHYFEPVADFYDDCGQSPVSFMYVIKFGFNDLPAAFINAKNCIIVTLRTKTTCEGRWVLRMKSKESAFSVLIKKKAQFSRLKFKVGRSSLLKDIVSIQLDHNWHGNTIAIENVEIVDAVTGETVVNANIAQQISVQLPVCDDEEQRQEFAAKILPSPVSNDQRNSMIRRKVTVVEYIMFTCLAMSILLITSLHIPVTASQLHGRNGITNGFVGATIGMTITFSAFAVYEFGVRRLWRPDYIKFIVMTCLLIASISLSVMAVTDSRVNQAKGSNSLGFWWLCGFAVGAVLILVVGAIFTHSMAIITNHIEEKNKPVSTSDSYVSIMKDNDNASPKVDVKTSAT